MGLDDIIDSVAVVREDGLAIDVCIGSESSGHIVSNKQAATHARKKRRLLLNSKRKQNTFVGWKRVVSNCRNERRGQVYADRKEMNMQECNVIIGLIVLLLDKYV